MSARQIRRDDVVRSKITGRTGPVLRVEQYDNGTPRIIAELTKGYDTGQPVYHFELVRSADDGRVHDVVEAEQMAYDEAAPAPIVITRERSYPVVARPGPAWRWSYHYIVNGEERQYGTGLASLRDLLKRKFPSVPVVLAWEATEPAPRTPQVGDRYMYDGMLVEVTVVDGDKIEFRAVHDQDAIDRGWFSTSYDTYEASTTVADFRTMIDGASASEGEPADIGEDDVDRVDPEDPTSMVVPVPGDQVLMADGGTARVTARRMDGDVLSLQVQRPCMGYAEWVGVEAIAGVSEPEVDGPTAVSSQAGLSAIRHGVVPMDDAAGVLELAHEVVRAAHRWADTESDVPWVHDDARQALRAAVRAHRAAGGGS